MLNLILVVFLKTETHFGPHVYLKFRINPLNKIYSQRDEMMKGDKCVLLLNLYPTN